MSYEQDTESKWRSRKWILALLCLAILTVGLFTGFIADTQLVIGMGTVLGLYSAVNYKVKQGKS